jgi:hypothetical protein
LGEMYKDFAVYFFMEELGATVLNDSFENE